jgi:acyl-CoA thioesterase-1
MNASHRTGLLMAAFVAALMSGAPTLGEPLTPAGSVNEPASCATPPGLSAIQATLDRSASRIAASEPVTIVAMGSSSTLGVGASAPAMSYPSRLKQELNGRFPGIDISVINHGVGGQDVPEELTRLERDVIAEHPDLVIWQVGTNAVLRRDDLSADEQLIERGISLMREGGIDVVLMDLQYAPRVLARPASVEMERLIAEMAQHAHVGLFRRFEIMQEWDRTHQLAPASAIGADGLHMTDASYGCLAKQLADALALNWWTHAKLAKTANRSPDTIAGIHHSLGTQRAISSHQR